MKGTPLIRSEQARPKSVRRAWLYALVLHADGHGMLSGHQLARDGVQLGCV